MDVFDFERPASFAGAGAVRRAGAAAGRNAHDPVPRAPYCEVASLEGDMKRMQVWMMVAGTAGLLSSALAACLLWLLLTHPVAVATFVGRGL